MKTTTQFWNWFKDHNQIYLSINEVDEDIKEELLDKLLLQLHEYCDQLYFEVGGSPGEKQELIISAEGDTDFFEQVEALVNSAPTIDDWIFTAFIQPQGCENTINYEDVELKPGEMWFMPLQSASNPKSIGIKVCSSNYDLVKKSEWFKSAVYKTLDTVLGEKSFALDIDHIDYGGLPENPEEQGMIKMIELPAYVKWKKAKD